MLFSSHDTKADRKRQKICPFSSGWVDLGMPRRSLTSSLHRRRLIHRHTAQTSPAVITHCSEKYTLYNSTNNSDCNNTILNRLSSSLSVLLRQKTGEHWQALPFGHTQARPAAFPLLHPTTKVGHEFTSRCIIFLLSTLLLSFIISIYKTS